MAWVTPTGFGMAEQGVTRLGVAGPGIGSAGQGMGNNFLTRPGATPLEQSMDIICEFLVTTTQSAAEAAEALARQEPTKPHWEIVVALKAALRDLQSAHLWALDAKRPTVEGLPVISGAGSSGGSLSSLTG